MEPNVKEHLVLRGGVVPRSEEGLLFWCAYGAYSICRQAVGF